MRYEFGHFSLDTERFELSGAGQPVRLQAKAFQILAYLVAHRDRVVSREELFAQCWRGRVVGDAALTTAIRTIRRSFGDSAEGPGVIRTVHRRGYRFAVDVIETDPASAAPDTVAARTDVRASKSRAAEFEREYKQISVLYCTLPDAGGLLDRQGPEAVDRFMQDFFRISDTVLAQYDGALLQRLEDGVAALFGAPLAQEDHARRAVLAALELRWQLCQEPVQGSPCGPAMGVHSGPVVVGSLADEPGRPYVAISETTRMARRLQKLAAPGELLVSEAVRAILGGEIDAEPMVAGNPPAYRVRDVAVRRAGVPRREADSTVPFLGRDRELDLLHERLLHAREGHGQIVAVIGEPGIGKSRLLREFRRDLDSVPCYQGHCLPYAANSPYLPVLELVRRCCEIRADDSSTVIAGKIEDGLERAGCAVAEALPLLLQFLNLPAEADALVRLSPKVQRERALSHVCDLVLHAHGRARAPHVILLEDLHWIDCSSQQWLTLLAGRISDTHTLLVLTCRPGYQTRWLDSVPVMRLILAPLTRQASVVLMRSLLPPLPNQLTRALVTRAAGNPFFLEELTRSVEATGNVDAIPDTVQGVLAARIDRLDAQDKRLLQTAAVIGTRVPLALWQAASGYTDDRIRAALGRLLKRGFLHETRSAAGRTWVFNHALTREVAYQSLLHSARQELHARVAHLIETQFAQSVFGQPEVLAHHHAAAGELRAAVAYWQLAGRQAYERSALPESIQYVSKGLEVLGELPADEDRTRLELRLQMTLGPTLMAARGYADPDVLATWSRARELCDRAGDTAGSFKARIGLWNYHWVRGESPSAVATARELLRLARVDRDPARLLRAHAALGEILFHMGRLREAGDHLARAVKCYHGLTHHSHATDAPGVACLCYSAWANWYLGHPEQALEGAHQALDLARGLQHPFSLAAALCLTAELHQFRLEDQATLELAQEAVTLCKEQGFPFWEGTALVLWGWAAARSGRIKAGTEAIDEGLEMFRSTGAEVQLSSWYSLLAEVHLWAGRIPQGLETVEQALGWVERTGERYYEPEALRLRGQLLRKCGEVQAADACFRVSIETARAQHARAGELRASVDLADLWREQGRVRSARDLLHPLYEDLAGGGDLPDLQRVRALMVALV